MKIPRHLKNKPVERLIDIIQEITRRHSDDILDRTGLQLLTAAYVFYETPLTPENIGEVLEAMGFARQAKVSYYWGNGKYMVGIQNGKLLIATELLQYFPFPPDIDTLVTYLKSAGVEGLAWK